VKLRDSGIGRKSLSQLYESFMRNLEA
jgi:hypothetical protein